MIFPEVNEIIEQRRIAEIDDNAARNKAFGDLLKRYPYNKAALFGRAYYCIFHGETEEAEAFLLRGVEAAPVDFEFYYGMSQVWSQRGDEARQNAWLQLAIGRALQEDEQWKRFESIFEGMEHELPGDPDDRRAGFFQLQEDLQIGTHTEPADVTEEMAPYRLVGELLDGAPGGMANGLVDRLMRGRKRIAPLLVGVLRNWAASEEWEDDSPLDAAIALLGQGGNPEHLPALFEFLDLERDSTSLSAAWAVWRIAKRHPLQAMEAFRSATPDLTGWARGAVAEILMRLPEEVDVTADLTGLCPDLESMENPDRGFLLCSVTAALIRRDSQRAARDLVRRYLKLLDKPDRKFLEELVSGAADWRFRLDEAEVFDTNVYDACAGLVFEGPESDGSLDEDEDPFEEDDGPTLRARLATGRNEPCWCGSGKKYKKCHWRDDQEEHRTGQAKEEVDFVEPPRPAPWDPDSTVHRLQAELVKAVAPSLEASDVKDALQRFTGNERLELEEENQAAFLDWLLHDYVPAGRSRNVIEEYVHRERTRLTAQDRTILEGWSGSRLSLYEVQSVDEGTGMVLRDLLRGGDYSVNDRTVSEQLVRWDCTVCRIEPFRDRWIFAGDGTLVSRQILPIVKNWAEAEQRKSGLDWEAFLKRDGHLIRRQVYLEGDRFRDSFAVSNNDGETLVFSTAEYELSNSGRAIEALREDRNFDETEEGTTFAWLGDEGDLGRRLLGHAGIAAGVLRLECNSRERLERGRERLEKIAGDCIRHKGDRFQPWQELATKDATPGPREAKPAQRPRVDPKVEAEVVGQYYEQHYGAWPDQPLPALGGQTPRAAVASAEGRAQVLELMKEFELVSARDRKAGRPTYDFSRLRAELGLEED